MQTSIGMNELRPGERGIVIALDAVGALRRRLLDIGLTGRTRVECLGSNTGGNLTAFRIRGAVIAIRTEDSRLVRVRREGSLWD